MSIQVIPVLKSKCCKFIVAAEAQGMNLRITSGYRSVDEQNALYAQGRTKPGNIVTKAKGGQSNHNFGLAFDVVEIKNGVALWDNDWNKIEKLGKKFGFEWGGDWTSFVDLPHFQMTFGYETSELLAMYNKGIMKNGYVKVK